MTKISAEIKAFNIGPHSSLQSKINLNKKKIAVFANNGSGKTFLSRAFRLLQDPSIDKVNKILTLGKEEGEFEFVIKETNDNSNREEKINLKLHRANQPEILNETKYIFHVFNSDYVRENIEAVDFLPNGEIEGYVIGKTKIDLSKEKKKLERIKKDLREKGDAFKQQVNKGKEELDSLNVRKNTSEYKFTSVDIYNNTLDYRDKKSFSELKVLNTMLGQMPDDLIDVEYSTILINTDFIDLLKSILETKYTLGAFSNEFKEKLNPKLSFIKQGVELIGGKTEKESNCPFCEQDFSKQAKDLIDQYVKFINDQESKVKESINNLIKELKNVETTIQNGSNTLGERRKKFDEIKKFIPSQMEDTLIDYSSISVLSNWIKKVEDLLILKRDNIQNVYGAKDYGEAIDGILNYLEEQINIQKINNGKIDLLNKNKKNSSNEKRELNRRLCKAKYQELHSSLSSDISVLKGLVADKEKIEKEISEKESQEKQSKKEKFIESFRFYLNFFFRDKYEFDENKFCLKFNNHLMTSRASDVLSDGEKSIVAFCNYLADIHRFIEKEKDYENLFFIIDDPISSLDFHFVYSVSQIIRGLHEDLNIPKSRFVIFTHNLEFMSILIRNKVVTDYYTLVSSDLQKMKDELVMPYEEHLRDILNITKGANSTHTTANSIRHVLETIQRFESPNTDLKSFLSVHKVLQNNEYIYSLMHDSSHGIIRTQKPYSEEMIKSGCEAVVEFVNCRYKGQIIHIS